MRTLSPWSIALSLFFSMSITQFATNAEHVSVQWAAAGNAQVMQRDFAALVSDFGSPAAPPIAPAAAAGRAAADAGGAIQTERLDPLISWVSSQGKAVHIGSRISAALGIGSGTDDLPVLGKGFRSDDGVIHAFDVSTTTAHVEVIILRKVGASGVAWRVTHSGSVITTVTVDSDVQTVPNDQYAEMLSAELAYWETKVPTTSPMVSTSATD